MFSQDFASLLLGLLCRPALLRPSFFRIQKNQKKLSTYPLLKNETAKPNQKQQKLIDAIFNYRRSRFSCFYYRHSRLCRWPLRLLTPLPVKIVID